MDRAALCAAHLDVRLGALNRALRSLAVRQQQLVVGLDRSAAPDGITDGEVELLLDRVDAFVAAPVRADAVADLTPTERGLETELRRLASILPTTLPFDELAGRWQLTELDITALVTLAAAELDRGYERIFAYLHDAPARGTCSVELVQLTTEGLADRHVQRMRLGPGGPLRRIGFVRSTPSLVGLRDELGLVPGFVDFLLGAPIDTAAFVHDGGFVDAERRVPIGEALHERIAVIAAALAPGLVDTIGVWCDLSLAWEPIRAIASRAGFSLRRVPFEEIIDSSIETFDAALRDATWLAGAGEALLVAELPLLRNAADAEARRSAVARWLITTHYPVVVVDRTPWRPPEVLAHRRLVELDVGSGDVSSQTDRWQHEVPGLDRDTAGDLAARFQLAPPRIAAAAATARTLMAIAGDDDVEADAHHEAIMQAAAIVSSAESSDLLHAIEPHRGVEDLILPPAVYEQVLEIAEFSRVLPTVAQEWGFGRLASGSTAIKALFIGEPGTGKTLAAEVIANVLGVQLLKVDLARLVSKWVGETTKHLDEVFRVAEASSAVLFFDEADALFGKRGDVKHGSDRYANSEISHLLQRFDQYDGLAILASNLRENIDPAFTRRFQMVVTFPRPQRDDRLRLWHLAFPPDAPLDEDIDLAFLARLDMTGAGVVGAARAAAFLAASAREPAITMSHVIRGVARQFRAEGRVVGRSDLGDYAGLLEVEA